MYMIDARNHLLYVHVNLCIFLGAPSASSYKSNMPMSTYNQTHTIATIPPHEEPESSETNKQSM